MDELESCKVSIHGFIGSSAKLPKFQHAAGCFLLIELGEVPSKGGDDEVDSRMESCSTAVLWIKDASVDLVINWQCTDEILGGATERKFDGRTLLRLGKVSVE